jgi:proteic killer suppression protein
MGHARASRALGRRKETSRRFVRVRSTVMGPRATAPRNTFLLPTVLCNVTVDVSYEGAEHRAQGAAPPVRGQFFEGRERGHRGQTPQELRGLPLWKAHVLTGDRKGTWSLSVTRNRRLTFRIEDDEIIDLNLEDYH